MKSPETGRFGLAFIKQTAFWSKAERNHGKRERYNHGARKQNKRARVKAPHKRTINWIY